MPNQRVECRLIPEAQADVCVIDSYLSGYLNEDHAAAAWWRHKTPVKAIISALAARQGGS
jgi:hypothetical protein